MVTGGSPPTCAAGRSGRDRKSTRLNSRHVKISYAVFSYKKKKISHLGPRARALNTFVVADRFRHLVADGEERVERGHGVLEDHFFFSGSGHPRDVLSFPKRRSSD